MEDKSNMTTMVVAFVIILVVIIAGGLFVVSQKDKENNPSTNNSANNTDNDNNSDNDADENPNAGEVDYTIDMANYSYSIKNITAKAGDTIRIKLVSKSHDHDLVIDELNVQSSLLDFGESEVIDIVIPKDASGEIYEYYCSVGDHRAKGMVGTLTVE